jgi:hypothetical protein
MACRLDTGSKPPGPSIKKESSYEPGTGCWASVTGELPEYTIDATAAMTANLGNVMLRYNMGHLLSKRVILNRNKFKLTHDSDHA